MNRDIQVSLKDVNTLINTPAKDYTYSFIGGFIFKRFDKKEKKMIPAKYPMDAVLVIHEGMYHNNKEKIETQLGRLIFNKFLLDDLIPKIGFIYINEPVTNKVLGKLNDKLSKALTDGVINMDDMKLYLNRLQFFFGLAAPISSAISLKTMMPIKEVIKRRDALVKENKEVLEKGGQEAAVVAARIEAELLDLARLHLKDDYGMDLYNSGAKASFDNNYKAMHIMKGPMLDPNTGEYIVSTSNYTEGIPPEEIPIYANSIVIGAYAKGKNTQVGGYMVKRLLAAFQNVVLDEPGTDCGSKTTLSVFITKENVNDYMYSWMVEGSKFVELTPENASGYHNRVVKLRSPQFCTTEKICSKCAGTYFYKLGIKNIGLTATRAGSSIMNKSLKKFHDVTVKVYDITSEDDVLI